MKRSLTQTVRLISPFSPDEVRRRLRFEFLTNAPYYEGAVQGDAFTLKGAFLQYRGFRYRAGGPELHFCLQESGTGTVIGLHMAPAAFSFVNIIRFLPVLFLAAAFIITQEVKAVLLSMIVIVPFFWLYWLSVRFEYVRTMDRVVLTLSQLLQATIEDVSVK